MSTLGVQACTRKAVETCSQAPESYEGISRHRFISDIGRPLRHARQFDVAPIFVSVRFHAAK